MLPATMMPEILPGRTSNPALERGRVFGHDSIHVRLAVAGGLDLHFLEAKHVASIRLTKRRAEDDRCSETEGEHRRPARRLRVAPEERHPGGSEADRPL